MKKEVIKKLREEAEHTALIYSDPNRSKNTNKELFKVSDIKPFCENAALVILLKNTGKKVLLFFYYIPAQNSWNYFIPTDGHLESFSEYVRDQKRIIEENNYKFNFIIWGVKMSEKKKTTDTDNEIKEYAEDHPDDEDMQKLKEEIDNDWDNKRRL